MMAQCTVVNDNRIAYDGNSHHWSDAMAADTEWEKKVKLMLKGELARRGITYAQLCGKLADIGVMDSEPNIRNKISRGKFTAVFLIQCLEAIGASSLRLSDA
jgi:hypothetical protein